ncbi:hypothetical protein BKI52_18265 [marine bacterium AO1-C]|nr:hypothetical protein BKI52_18265 [marine bacterium AO1-C]
MKKTIFILFAFLLVSQINFAQDAYKLDNLHTSVRFKVQHLGVALFTGGFDQFEGTLKYAPEKLKDASLTFKVKVNSVNTGNNRRNAHLQKEDFFDAEKYPEMTFKSTYFKKGKNSKDILVDGMLTIRGVTKAVTFKVKDLGARDIPNFGFRRGFTATTQIKRSEFGVNYGLKQKLLGDEVTIEVFTEFIKSK